MFCLLQTIDFAMLMQTMEDRQATSKEIDRLEERMDERFDRVDAEFGRIDMRFQGLEADIRELRSDLKSTAKDSDLKGTAKELRGEMQSGFQELRADIGSLQRSMLFGFFSLAGIILTYAGFQLS